MAATPQDAATLVLMRDSIDAGSRPEVLLVKRCPDAVGAPGTYAFPGGPLTPTDTIPSALALSRTFTAAEAALRLPAVQPDSRALSFWIAALRTTFEQAGLLLARYGDGRLWQPNGPDVQRLLQHRRAMLQGSTNFPNMMHDLERALATDLLIYFAHGITPEKPALLLSRRFFFACVPSGVSALPDQYAVGASLWVTPEEALQRQGNGALALGPVTTKILHLLRPFPSAAAAVEHLRRQPVELVGQ
jgi:hypothetical protein